MVSENEKALAVLFVLLSMGSATQAFAGNCQHPDDTAADDHCGGRSADSAPAVSDIKAAKAACLLE
ncbi:transmembrane anchored protein [Klebsiella pneumoniae]|nr:transmembrane anchored protein [Klebsiella pneumoniae]